MQKTIIAVVLAAVLAGAAGFFGGVTYQKVQSPSLGGFAGRGGFARTGAGAGGGANVATGTVLAVDAKSITVKTADGGSKTVFLSAQTAISKQQVLTPADIKVGDEVGAFGQTANGGIDARMVQIVPPGGSFRFGGMGGGGRPAGAGGAGAGAGTGTGQ
jgi:hypothetical protein